MTAPKDRFWAKVLFKEFIRHYRKLNDEEIVKDVKQSMDDLDDLNEQGETFGAKMVKWSIERKDTPRAEAARANGALGGRPPSNHTNETPRRCPRNKDEFEQFIYEPSNGINTEAAWEWFDIHKARDWTDKDGNPIKNWKGAVKNYSKAKENAA